MVIKEDSIQKNKRCDDALSEGLQSLEYAYIVKKKAVRDKNYVNEMIEKDPDFKKLLGGAKYCNKYEQEVWGEEWWKDNFEDNVVMV